MRDYLVFAGKTSHDFGVHISGEATYNRPERNYEEVTVPGRSGTLIIDEGSFKNQEISYPAFVIGDMPDKVKDFANFMSSFAGYQRLEDSYADDIFRLAQYKSGLEVTPSGHSNRNGQFNIVFNCKPQRYLKSGEIPIAFETDGQIWNRTNFNSKPFITVYGSGAGTVGIGDFLITISEIDEFVNIDCELMDAYKGATNCNGHVSFNADEILVPSGKNGVTFTGDITSVVITPNYFII